MESGAPIEVKDVNEKPADKPKAIIKKDNLRCVYLVTNGRCRNIVSRTSMWKFCEKHEQLYEDVRRVYVNID